MFFFLLLNFYALNFFFSFFAFQFYGAIYVAEAPTNNVFLIKKKQTKKFKVEREIERKNKQANHAKIIWRENGIEENMCF